MGDLDDFYAFKSTTKNYSGGGRSGKNGSGGGSDDPGCLTWTLLWISVLGLVLMLLEHLD